MYILNFLRMSQQHRSVLRVFHELMDPLFMYFPITGTSYNDTVTECVRYADLINFLPMNQQRRSVLCVFHVLMDPLFMYFLITGTPYNETVCEVCGPDKFSLDESATQICSPYLSCTNGSSIYVLSNSRYSI